jgi:hypothetical protein
MLFRILALVINAHSAPTLDVGIQGKLISYDEKTISLKLDSGKKINISRKFGDGNLSDSTLYHLPLNALNALKIEDFGKCRPQSAYSSNGDLRQCSFKICYGVMICGEKTKIFQNYMCLANNGECPKPEVCLKEDLSIEPFATSNSNQSGGENVSRPQ